MEAFLSEAGTPPTAHSEDPQHRCWMALIMCADPNPARSQSHKTVPAAVRNLMQSSHPIHEQSGDFVFNKKMYRLGMFTMQTSDPVNIYISRSNKNVSNLRMSCDAPTKACKRQTFWLVIWNPFQDFLNILIFVINYCKTNWSDWICSQIVFSISNGLFKSAVNIVNIVSRCSRDLIPHLYEKQN